MLDLCDGDADAVTRLFADLGADVLKVEPPGGCASRAELPSVAGASVPFALNNANKRSAVLDPADASDRDRFIDLAAGADIVVDSGNPGRAAAFGTSCAELSQRYPHLVAMSVTDFGVDRPAGVLARHRPGVLRDVDGAVTVRADGRPPGVAAERHRVGHRRGTGRLGGAGRLLPPVALRHGRLHRLLPLRSRRAVARSAVRIGGAGRRRPEDIPTSCGAAGPETSRSTRHSRVGTVTSGSACCRHGNGGECGRGWVSRSSFRIRSSTRSPRATARPREINALIAELFAAQTMDELVTAGQSRGVPIAAVLSPAETLSSEHFRSVGALTDATIAPGVDVTVPVGAFVVDGRHVGFARPAPPVGGDEAAWSTTRSERPADAGLRDREPAVRRPADSRSRRHRRGR